MIAAPGRQVAIDDLRRMGCAMRHRGPDDEGYLTWSPCEAPRVARTPGRDGGRVGLVHKRLSILDLSSLGWQPMSSRDGRFHIVYNGEVYNFVELRRELERLGHCFDSRSDTEVLLAAIVEWGVVDAVRRFEGMFAFALLDVVRAEVALVRDPFGIKPLYYCWSEDRFVFGSEIKAVLAAGQVAREVNPRSLFAYLTSGESEHGEETMLSAVRQLPPASVLKVAVGDTVSVSGPQTYWELRPDRSGDIDPTEAARMVRDRLIANLERHLRSDVPVGTALSGGIDSSAIVDGLRRVAPRELELHAFSYVADDPRLSEERWIRLAAGAAEATVHDVRVGPDALKNDADALILAQDEPFSGTSMYAQFAIFRAAHEAGIKVMLDGQGADELFGGYASYLGPHVSWLARHGRLWSALRLMVASSGRADVHANDIARYVAASSLPRWFKRRVSAARRPSTPSWMNGEWFSDRAVAARPRLPDAGADLRAQLARSVRTGLLALLRYEDRNSMAFSVESRVPFLTTGLAELALSLPPSLLIANDGTRKAVLRDAMRGIVPDEILDRRDKIGFQTPEASLLAGTNSWAASVLESSATESIPCFDRRELERITDSVQRGAATSGVPLWRLLNLIRWSELFDVRFT